MNIIILLRSNNSTDKLLSTTRLLHESNYNRTQIRTYYCNKNATIYINWRTGTENHKVTMQIARKRIPLQEIVL